MSDVQRGRSQEAILNAAARIIRTQGVLGTTISRLVTESGTSAGAIYHHFPNKNAVVLAVAHNTLQWPLQALEAYRDSPSSPQELLTFALDSVKADPDSADLLVQLGAGAATDDELGRGLRNEFGALRDELDVTLIRWAERNDVPRARVLGLGQLVVGLVLGFATQRNLVNSFDEDAYLEAGTALLTIQMGRDD